MITRTGNLTLRQILGLMRQCPAFRPARPYSSVARMRPSAEPTKAPALDPKLIRAHLAAATGSLTPRSRNRRKVRR